jgi:hypothetical protein
MKLAAVTYRMGLSLLTRFVLNIVAPFMACIFALNMRSAFFVPNKEVADCLKIYLPLCTLSVQLSQVSVKLNSESESNRRHEVLKFRHVNLRLAERLSPSQEPWAAGSQWTLRRLMTFGSAKVSSFLFVASFSNECND